MREGLKMEAILASSALPESVNSYKFSSKTRYNPPVRLIFGSE